MTGTVQKISAVAAAVGLCLGLLLAPHLNSAIAQNEPEPETTPLEEPQPEPTEWVPITAGDALRGAPAPSMEAAPSPAGAETASPAPTPAEIASPANEPSPAATPIGVSTSAQSPAAFGHSTISRERRPNASRIVAPEPRPAPTTHGSGSSKPEKKASKKGAGPQIVPENSPFGNFGNQKGPIDITSDSGTLDYQNKFFLYTGHVHAVQAGGDLTSDTLKAQYGQDFNDIKMIYADGNVRMSQGTRWITSDHAVLDQTKHVLSFRGNPVVHDAADQITGSLITVDLVTGKSTVENPRMVIFPRESKNPDNVTAPDSP